MNNTFTVLDGYDKKTVHTVRKLTFEELKNHIDNNQEFLFISKQGTLRRCRRGSALKTWKRDPSRLECTFKYGLYESARLDTQQMLDVLVVKI